ncbi:MAG TPA: class I SAM-dependent methyltransferase [Aggregatilineales bacterium]|nr:class I SAM-dependent methyltransferase [Aggregatilineales bacterium]
MTVELVANAPTLHTLIASYRNLSWRDRLHMIIRWRVCPMRRIAALLPAGGVVVDLGCGHGLFTQLLARTSARREVIGVDLDAHKIAIAQQLQLPNLRFIASDVADADLPPAAGISILDLFYLVPFEVQEHLLEVCSAKLSHDGVIVLKDMAETPRWKLALNWLEETLAVRVLRITASADGGRFYFRTRAQWQSLFEQLGFRVETIALDRGYYHPHVVFIARKAG